MKTLLKKVKIAGRQADKIWDILFDDKIIEIGENIDSSSADKVVNGYGLMAMPGLIDVHVHLREPGYEYKEDIATGTMAAAAGGFTLIMAMPNLNPFPDNIKAVEKYQKLIDEKARVNVVPYICITKSERGKELVDMKAFVERGYFAFSDDGVGVQDESMMREAMIKAGEVNAMIAAHTEDNAYRKPYSCINEGRRSKELNLIGIPNECEYKQLERDLKIAAETGCAYHCCHMSARESVELLRKYKAKGADVSGEVTAHHLLLNEDIVENANHKMNPPLRSEEDRKALIKGILDNTIEIIANDHAPHGEDEKNKPIEKSPFGIVSLETAFPLLYTHLVKKNIISLDRLIELMSSAPAKRFGFSNKGKLEEGFDSDIVLVDLSQRYVIDKNKFYSKGKNTPFHNYECYGKIKKTFVNGILQYEEE